MQGIEQYRPLLGPVKRTAKGIPHGKVHKHRARSLHLGAEISTSRYHDGWDARLFNHSGDQTYGLVIKRSRRDQNKDIHPFLLQALR